MPVPAMPRPPHVMHVPQPQPDTVPVPGPAEPPEPDQVPPEIIEPPSPAESPPVEDPGERKPVRGGRQWRLLH